MKKLLYLLLSSSLALALSAAGQSANQGQSQTQTPPVNSTTPANQIGSGAQTKAGTPATSPTTSPNGQVNPTGTAQPPAAGGVSGAASSSASQPPSGENPGGVSALSDSDLESQIQNALNKEPTLSGNSTHVKVSGDSIELGGNVGTNKEKVTATRIVQSYAGSRKVVNNLTVGGHSGNTTSPRSEQPDQTDRTTNPASSGNANPNPASNPEPNKGVKPPHQ